VIRISGGEKRGFNILTIEKRDLRPASSRLRLALFNMVEALDKSILDLFAGCGSLGLEALSRGASSALFVDSDRDCVRIINENLRKTGYESRVIKNCAFKYAERLKESYDLVLIDPPFRFFSQRKNDLETLLERVLAHSIIVVVKHPKDVVLGKPMRTKVYGDASLSIYGN